jgi:hypothetical protein
MKKFFYLMVGILSLGVFGLKAQVNMGNLSDPHSAAVLDLSKIANENLGLLLPRVPLNNVAIFQLLEVGTSTADTADGMLVFNTKPEIVGGKGIGVYVWYNRSWHPLLIPGSGTDPEPELTPCGNDDIVLWNEAYEAVDPTVALIVSPAYSADIVNSDYFRKLGHNLCIQKRTETSGDEGVSWTDAQTTCTGDWRLPNLAELAAINKQGGTVFRGYGMLYDRRYWSTTLTEKNQHWYFHFDTNTGGQGSGLAHLSLNDNQCNNVFVRCVRTGE